MGLIFDTNYEIWFNLKLANWVVNHVQGGRHRKVNTE